MSDWTGGLLTRIMDPSVEFDRFYWSSCATWFKRQLTLGPLERDLGSAALMGKDVTCGAEYANAQYVAFSDHVIRVNSDETLTDLRTLTAGATQMLVYRMVSGASNGASRLVVCYGVNAGAGNTGYDIYDGTTWTAGVATEGAQYMTVWDDRLVKVDTLGNMKYTTDLATWTALPAATGYSNQVPLQAGSVTGLFVYPASTAFGTDALMIATTEGLYFYDDTAQKIRRTQLILPRLFGQGTGTVVHLGVVYFPSALQLLRYTGSSVDPVGLDRDWGLPADHRGTIATMASGVTLLVAAVDTTSSNALGSPMFTGGDEVAASVVGTNRGFPTLFIRTDRGWHTLWTSNYLAGASKWVGPSTANSVAGAAKFRFFFGADNKLKVMDVYPYIQNPTENNLQQYRSTGEHITPWNDIGWTEIDKLALQLKFVGEQINVNCTNGPCKVDVFYGTDFNTQWNFLTSVTTNRPTPVSFSNPTGLVFKQVRFKYVFTRCDNTYHTPIMRYAVMTFIKMIDARWGYRFSIDTSQQQYAGVTPEEIAAQLRALAGSNTLGTFEGWVSGQYVQRQVRVVTVSGAADAGPDMRGQYQVSCVAFS